MHTPTSWRPLRQAPLCKGRNLKPTKAHLRSIKWPKARPGPWSRAPRVHRAFGAAPRPSGPRPPCTCGECGVSLTQQARGGRGGGRWSRALEQHPDPVGLGRRACVEDAVSAPCNRPWVHRAWEQHADPAGLGCRAYIENAVSALRSRPQAGGRGVQGLGAARRHSGPGPLCTRGERSVSPMQQALGCIGPWSSTQTQLARAAVHAWRTQCQPHALGTCGGSGVRVRPSRSTGADRGLESRGLCSMPPSGTRPSAQNTAYSRGLQL